VVEHKDVVSLAPEDTAQGVGDGSGGSSGSSSGNGGGGGGGGGGVPVERRMDPCSSSVDNEGGWLSIATSAAVAGWSRHCGMELAWSACRGALSSRERHTSL
jgi:hypothetical protein